MNTKLGTEAKNDFEEHLFKLMNNVIFGKTMENVRKYRDIKLVTTDKRRNHLASEPNYHTTKYFQRIFFREVLLFILKPKIIMKTLLMMPKNGLAHLTMIIIDCFQ